MTLEHGTFSAAIDQVTVLGGRGSSEKSRLLGYARATIREAQTKREFQRDHIEDQIIATAVPFIWQRPADFRFFNTVRYPNSVFPKFIMPGKSQLGATAYFYPGPTYYVFVGVEIGETIDISYMRYLTSLRYYIPAERPAIYDLDTLKWKYLDPTGAYVDNLATAALEEAARDKVTNWILFDWFELVKEGMLAKLYKINNDNRAVSSFALFKSFIEDLVRGEPVVIRTKVQQ